MGTIGEIVTLAVGSAATKIGQESATLAVSGMKRVFTRFINSHEFRNEDDTFSALRTIRPEKRKTQNTKEIIHPTNYLKR